MYNLSVFSNFKMKLILKIKFIILVISIVRKRSTFPEKDNFLTHKIYHLSVERYVACFLPFEDVY